VNSGNRKQKRGRQPETKKNKKGYRIFSSKHTKIGIFILDNIKSNK